MLQAAGNRTQRANVPCVPRGETLSLLGAKALASTRHGEKLPEIQIQGPLGDFWQNETKYYQSYSFFLSSPHAGIITIISDSYSNTTALTRP
jgi:hypothetical protein